MNNELKDQVVKKLREILALLLNPEEIEKDAMEKVMTYNTHKGHKNCVAVEAHEVRTTEKGILLNFPNIGKEIWFPKTAVKGETVDGELIIQKWALKKNGVIE